MQAPQSSLHDAIVVGAGPVGLLLACELRLGGCNVLVLEQAEHPHSPLKRLPFGLRGLSVATLESLDRRGLLDDLETRMTARDVILSAHWMNPTRQPGGHFAGMPFFHDQVDTRRWPHRAAASIRTLAADMETIDAVLTARAIALGVEIRRGCAVQGVEQADDHVVARAGKDAFRGRWLIGCDGGRSAVRKSAGIDFTGTDPEFSGYSVLVELAGPTQLAPGRHRTATGMYTFTPPGTIAMVDFDGGAFHRMTPVTRGHVETVLRKVSGVDVSVSAVELATTWTDRAYQATGYRQGRILLAGDAAHVHSPLGGQGLNLGLGDAMNLGWKLASVIRGDVPARLLDSYDDERRPIGAEVLAWSRAQVASMRPDTGSSALAAVVRDLIATRNGATYVAERVWGIGVRYDLGCDHPLVGRSAPDVPLMDGSRLNEHLRHGRGVLLDVDRRESLRALVAGRDARLTYVCACARDALGPRALLIRPDGIVAWAGEGAADVTGAGAAVARWFGD